MLSTAHISIFVSLLKAAKTPSPQHPLPASQSSQFSKINTENTSSVEGIFLKGKEGSSLSEEDVFRVY